MYANEYAIQQAGKICLADLHGINMASGVGRVNLAVS